MVIDSIIGQLTTRFSQPALDRLLVIETVLLDSANSRTQSLDHSIAGLPETLNVYKALVDFDKLRSQLSMLPSVIATVNDMNKESNVRPIATVSSVKSLLITLNDSKFGAKMCAEVYRLGSIYLTVPMTSATAERSFSTMRRIKTYLRQTITQQRLNDCMLLHIHKERTYAIDMQKIAARFVESSAAAGDRFRYFESQQVSL